MTWWKYVQGVAGEGERQATIAEKTGVAHPTVGRWKVGSPDAMTAVRFARAYGRPVLEALIAAGFITADEAGQQPAAPVNLAQLDDDALVREISRRLARKEASDAGHAEAQKTTTAVTPPTQLHPRQSDQWAARTGRVEQPADD